MIYLFLCASRGPVPVLTVLSVRSEDILLLARVRSVFKERALYADKKILIAL